MSATPRRLSLILILTSILLALIGLYLGVGGALLARLGGSLYYLITGAALLVTAALVWRGRASSAR
jgi:glucose dehydrogenase